jgi:hypothetical protein
LLCGFILRYGKSAFAHILTSCSDNYIII